MKMIISTDRTVPDLISDDVHIAYISAHSAIVMRVSKWIDYYLLWSQEAMNRFLPYLQALAIPLQQYYLVEQLPLN